MARSRRSRKVLVWIELEELGHLAVEEALAWPVGLDPFAVDDELWDGSLAYVLDYFVSGPGAGLDIDLGVGNAVLFKEAFCFAAIAAPRRGINQNLHLLMISTTLICT
jgi:hypothetical protein